MPTSAQVRELLLEEALLYLLRNSGYNTITGICNDPTLQSGSAGLVEELFGIINKLDLVKSEFGT